MEKDIQLTEIEKDKLNANKSRINAWISKMNYGFIDRIMENKNIM